MLLTNFDAGVSGDEDDEDDEGEGEEGGAASVGTHKSRVYDMDGDDKLLNDDEVVQHPDFHQSIHPSISHPVLFSTIHSLYLSWSIHWIFHRPPVGWRISLNSYIYHLSYFISYFN